MSRPPVVDAHVHMWDLHHPQLRWDWLAPDATHPILGDIDAIKSVKFDARAMIAESRFAGVQAFVHVQAAIGSADPVVETVWVDEQYRAIGLAGAIVAYVELSSDTAPTELARHAAASAMFTGVRDFATEAYVASGRIDAGYEQSLAELTERGLILDLDCEWQHMAAAAKLARRHPELQIVLEHIGYPRRRDQEYFTAWSAGIAELATAPNVMCKISGVGMTDRSFSEQSLRPWVAHCLDVFGWQRAMIGSNWPVDRIASSYDVIMDLYREFVGHLTTEEQDAVLAGNAMRIYRITAAADTPPRAPEPRSS